MDHKPLTVDGALAQWREWTRHLRADARTALMAARHDLDRTRKTLAGLRSNSQLLAYVQAKLRGEAAAAPASPARRARKTAR